MQSREKIIPHHIKYWINSIPTAECALFQNINDIKKGHILLDILLFIENGKLPKFMTKECNFEEMAENTLRYLIGKHGIDVIPEELCHENVLEHIWNLNYVEIIALLETLYTLGAKSKNKSSITTSPSETALNSVPERSLLHREPIKVLNVQYNDTYKATSNTQIDNSNKGKTLSKSQDGSKNKHETANMDVKDADIAAITLLTERKKRVVVGAVNIGGDSDNRKPLAKESDTDRGKLSSDERQARAADRLGETRSSSWSKPAPRGRSRSRSRSPSSERHSNCIVDSNRSNKEGDTVEDQDYQLVFGPAVGTVQLLNVPDTPLSSSEKHRLMQWLEEINVQAICGREHVQDEDMRASKQRTYVYNPTYLEDEWRNGVMLSELAASKLKEHKSLVRQVVPSDNVGDRYRSRPRMLLQKTELSVKSKAQALRNIDIALKALSKLKGLQNFEFANPLDLLTGRLPVWSLLLAVFNASEASRSTTKFGDSKIVHSGSSSATLPKNTSKAINMSRSASSSPNTRGERAGRSASAGRKIHRSRSSTPKRSAPVLDANHVPEHIEGTRLSKDLASNKESIDIHMAPSRPQSSHEEGGGQTKARRKLAIRVDPDVQDVQKLEAKWDVSWNQEDRDLFNGKRRGLGRQLGTDTLLRRIVISSQRVKPSQEVRKGQDDNKENVHVSNEALLGNSMQRRRHRAVVEWGVTPDGPAPPPSDEARDLSMLPPVTRVQMQKTYEWLYTLGLSVREGEGGVLLPSRKGFDAGCDGDTALPLFEDRLRNGELLCDLVGVLEANAAIHSKLPQLIHRKPASIALALDNINRAIWLLRIRKCPPIPAVYLSHANAVLEGKKNLLWGLLFEIMQAYPLDRGKESTTIVSAELGGKQLNISNAPGHVYSVGEVTPSCSDASPFPYSIAERRQLDVKLMNWFVSLGLLRGLLLSLNCDDLPSILILEGPLRDGTFLCDLVQKLCGDVAVVGVVKFPKSYKQKIENIRKAMNRLMCMRVLKSKYFRAGVERDIVMGDWAAILGLLDALHKYHCDASSGKMTSTTQRVSLAQNVSLTKDMVHVAQKNSTWPPAVSHSASSDWNGMDGGDGVVWPTTHNHYGENVGREQKQDNLLEALNLQRNSLSDDESDQGADEHKPDLFVGGGHRPAGPDILPDNRSVVGGLPYSSADIVPSKCLAEHVSTEPVHLDRPVEDSSSFPFRGPPRSSQMRVQTASSRIMNPSMRPPSPSSNATPTKRFSTPQKVPKSRTPRRAGTTTSLDTAQLGMSQAHVEPKISDGVLYAAKNVDQLYNGESAPKWVQKIAESMDYGVSARLSQAPFDDSVSLKSTPPEKTRPSPDRDRRDKAQLPSRAGTTSFGDILLQKKHRDAEQITQWLGDIGFDVSFTKKKPTKNGESDEYFTTDFADGILLYKILNKLTNNSHSNITGFFSQPKTKAHKVNNIRKVLSVLSANKRIPLSALQCEGDIYEGNATVIVGLLLVVRDAYKIQTRHSH